MHQHCTQTSGWSVQAKNMNTNAKDDMFPAFILLWQIMTHLLDV
jgi:hypothetical protein